MSDIQTAWSGLDGDWVLAGGDLASDTGLQSAVIISLFSDAQAEALEVPAGSGRRGWWGDAYADVAGDRTGSKLWLLAREKQTAATLRRAEGYCREALQWLIDDGVARAVTARAEWHAGGVLALALEVARSAQPVARFRFDLFWAGG